MTIAFNGTYLGLLAKKSNVYGIAKITLDKGTPKMVDLYSATTVYQQKVWNTGTLASGDHTVTIEWTGTKNDASTDTNIGIDGLDLKGSLKQATSGDTPPPPAPDPTVVRYEQTDSHLAYGGPWSTYSCAGPSSGAYKRTSTDGASVTIAFKGTYLAWVGTKGLTLGKAQVSLDGGAAKTVDLATTAVSYQQKLWETGTLSSGAHTVIIRWDASNAAGKFVGLDAVDVIGTLTTATAAPFAPAPVIPPTTRYEQKDTRFTFAGGWIASSSTWRRPPASASPTPTASATATFNGTYLVWIGKKSPDYGQAKVTVDGGTPAIVDLYNDSAVWQQKVWDTGVLPAGDHTVKIEWTGVKNANGLGANINVDAFDIAGTVTQAPAAAAVRYEQGDSHFVYAGTWTNSRTSLASGGNFRYSDAKGSSVTVRFTGSSLAWIAKKSPVYGMAKITVDGGTPVTVDLYSAATVYGQKVWETGMLVPGTHTVKIEWTGTKNSAATDTNIGVDAFDIVGTLKYASGAGRRRRPVPAAPTPAPAPDSPGYPPSRPRCAGHRRAAPRRSAPLRRASCSRACGSRDRARTPAARGRCPPPPARRAPARPAPSPSPRTAARSSRTRSDSEAGTPRPPRARAAGPPLPKLPGARPQPGRRPQARRGRRAG